MRLSRGDQVAGLLATDARDLMRRFDDVQPESMIGTWADTGSRTGAKVACAFIDRAKAFNADGAHLIDITELVVFGSYLDPEYNVLETSISGLPSAAGFPTPPRPPIRGRSGLATPRPASAASTPCSTPCPGRRKRH